ncbi:CRISPR-associated endonuclease Cas2 [candidate division KSB1 bacterium]|nr:MAG: CRISPR-associated endonuclease Cas2 [candidate division KSB1 bacterium]MBC6948751.1 CRISPR-associated endonuclease Cas2 [candidate division KSB1 bacterium]MCE7945540.1 CRISPR-associated endonuclease Cas2 [Chlorobi bacterium CHB1]MDL1877998.1 CRISPR-associated endonuclease Cas2 [Cytophagia bacterium CHB2]
MFVLISYDITDDKVRFRLARTLKDFGKRVQRSVFEAEITEAELTKLHQKLAQVRLDSDDSIRLYRLCDGCVKGVKIWGSGEVTKDPDIIVL